MGTFGAAARALAAVLESVHLGERVTLEQRAGGRDGHGQPAGAWTTVAADLPASVQPLVGELQLAARQVDATLSHRVVIAYRPGVVAGQRFLHRGEVLWIHAVSNLASTDSLVECLCKLG